MKETRFKQTEIGLIPEDWEILYLYNISQNAMYGVGAPSVKYDGTNKYIRITDINDTNGCFEPMPLVSPEWFLDKYIVKENDILIARTGASVGKCYLYKQSDGKLIFAGFLMRLNIINADSKFTFYQLCTEHYRNWITSESARTGQPGVNLQQIKSFGIPSPQSMREQHNIASALTSIDNLLLSLDKLIEKKRLIKQGAMQELLTGKKRLPGFTGEWIEKRLGEIGEIIKESINPQLYRNQSFSEYSMPAYDLNKQPEIKYGEEMFSNRTKIDGTVLLYNKLNVRQRRIWYIENCKQNSICSMEFLPYKVYRDYLKFFYYKLSIDSVVNYFVGISKGTSNSQKRISPNDFLDFKVTILR